MTVAKDGGGVFDALDRLHALPKPAGPADPGTVEALRREIIDRVRRDPLVQRYAQWIDARVGARGGVRVTEPWQALGEQRVTAFSVANAAVGDEEGHLRLADEADYGSPAAARQANVAFAWRLLNGAATYLWSAAIEELVAAAPLPRHVVSRDLLPHAWMFFSYETAYHLTKADGVYWGDVDWMALEHQPDGIAVMYIVAKPDRSAELISQSVPYGKTWPDDFGDDAERGGAATILRRLAFINSPYVETLEHRLPRPIRREMKRLGHDVASDQEPLCRTVVLRRAAAEAQARHDAETAPGHDWRGHWWVSGHFRAQWYPSEEAHKVIWIAPYVKGDLDKPLIEKTYAVVR